MLYNWNTIDQILTPVACLQRHKERSSWSCKLSGSNSIITGISSASTPHHGSSAHRPAEPELECWTPPDAAVSLHYVGQSPNADTAMPVTLRPPHERTPYACYCGIATRGPGQQCRLLRFHRKQHRPEIVPPLPCCYQHFLALRRRRDRAEHGLGGLPAEKADESLSTAADVAAPT